jgi:hypothetical protein
MKNTPFNPSEDAAPIPFEPRHLEMALSLKKRGLAWKPHVGCFVWDFKEQIEADSPFPQRIYFILNLNRFIKLFGSLESVADNLVWLPSWHQARLIAAGLGINREKIQALWSDETTASPGDELLELYGLILDSL